MSTNRFFIFVVLLGVWPSCFAQPVNDNDTLKQVGVRLQDEQKYEDSVQTFQRVLKADPQYSQINFLLGISYMALNRFPQATEAFERELKNPAPAAGCRYYLALALDSMGRSNAAITQLELLLKENPKDVDALYQIARLHKNASLDAMRVLHDVEPDSFQLHILRGEIYADEERYEESIREYRSALAKRPQMRRLHQIIGLSYWKLIKLELAEQELLLARGESPEDPVTNLYLGDIAVFQNRFKEAITYLHDAEVAQHHLDPTQKAQLHFLFGKCYIAAKDLEKAKSELTAAIEANPTDERPHYVLSRVFRQLGDVQASARELEAVQKIKKANEPGTTH
jgi:tetratricopeptide (TPR) repeat protein